MRYIGSIHTCLGVWQGCRLRSLPSSAIPQFLPVSRVSAICFSTSPPISFRKYGQLRSKQWSGGQDQHYMLIFKNWTHVRDCDAGPRKKNVHRCRDRFTRALFLSIHDRSGYFVELIVKDYNCESLLIWPAESTASKFDLYVHYKVLGGFATFWEKNVWGRYFGHRGFVS